MAVLPYISLTPKPLSLLESGADTQGQADALIRAQFGVNPERLQVSEWVKLYAQALWLEGWRLKNQAEMMERLFGGGN